MFIEFGFIPYAVCTVWIGRLQGVLLLEVRIE